MPADFFQFLYRATNLAERMSRLEDSLAELESVCRSMTADYSKIGSSGGSGGAKDANLAALSDLRTRVARCRRDLTEAENEFTRFCEHLNPKDALLMKHRYAMRESWPEIHAALRDAGFDCTERTMFNWHRQAKRHAREIWEEEYVRTDE
jgi:hypothetical protein